MAEKNDSITSQLLNVALILAVVILVGLVIYGNQFHNQPPPPPPTVAENVTGVIKTTTNSNQVAKITNQQVYHINKSLVSPLTGATHPPKPPTDPKPLNLTGTPEKDAEFKKIITRQSADLRAESASQGMRPEDKSSLALTEEEIRELENSDRMIY